jgi:hypothetical protein
MSVNPLEEVRRICLSFPESSERLSHGEPTWFVREKKVFVTYADHHHDDRIGFWCAAPPGVQEQLVETDPEHFFRPPYVGHRGWVGVYLDVPVNWAMVASLIEDSYRTVAPSSLVKLLDDSVEG